MQSSSENTRRPLPLNILDLELAFEARPDFESELAEPPSRPCLDLETGQVVWPKTQEEIDACSFSTRYLAVPQDVGPIGFPDLERFIASLENGPNRDRLAKAIRGRGPFRRFNNIVYGLGDIELRHAWTWFATRRIRERIILWLDQVGIDPQWDFDILQPPALPNRRPELLGAVLNFVRKSRHLHGVRRISLLGSLATDKPHPKDLDLLVVIDDAVPLDPLAKLKRQLQGRAAQTGDSRGADVFIASPTGVYLGRICPWKECRPGKRQSCEAQHCGRRTFLYDDLHHLRLDPKIIAHPPIELWPALTPADASPPVPHDVAELLLKPLSNEPS